MPVRQCLRLNRAGGWLVFWMSLVAALECAGQVSAQTPNLVILTTNKDYSVVLRDGCDAQYPWMYIVRRDKDFRPPEQRDYTSFFLRVAYPHLAKACPSLVESGKVVVVGHYADPTGILQGEPASEAHLRLLELDSGEPTYWFSGARVALRGAQSTIATETWGNQSYQEKYHEASQERAQVKLAEAAAQREAARRAQLYLKPDSDLRHVRVCNRGELDIAVTVLNTYSEFGKSKWHYRSWMLVPGPPISACRGVTFMNGGHSHLVFALVGADHRLGLVQYTKEGIPPDRKVQMICVSDRKVDESGTGAPTRYQPPCPAGFLPAPTSATAYTQDSFLGNQRGEVVVTVHPVRGEQPMMTILNGSPTHWRIP